MLLIIPDFVKDAINTKLDIAFKEVPEAEKDRDVLYHQLLEYFDEHGEIPDFQLRKNT